jgi:hypothetical protein
MNELLDIQFIAYELADEKYLYLGFSNKSCLTYNKVSAS